MTTEHAPLLVSGDQYNAMRQQRDKLVASNERLREHRDENQKMVNTAQRLLVSERQKNATLLSACIRLVNAHYAPDDESSIVSEARAAIKAST